MSNTSTVSGNRAISRLVTLALVALAVLAIGGLSAVILTYRGADRATADLAAQAFATHERALELGVTEKNMEIDIIQIQQFAQDAAAVRGGDGVAEDYGYIKKYAQTFVEDSAKARAIGVEFNDNEMLQIIDSLNSAVPAYRDLGLKMASTYVEHGTDAGNVQMEPFDAETDRLTTLVSSLRNNVTQVVSRAHAQVDAVDAQRNKTEGMSLIISGLIGVLLAASIAGMILLFQRRLLTPIRRLTDTMASLSRHDLTVEIDGAGRKDEIGDMASAVQIFRDSMVEADRLKTEQEAQRQRAEAKGQRLAEISTKFEANVSSIVQAVASQSSQMQSSAKSMTMTAEETAKQAGAVAAASEESATNVQTVASAAEELSSSIAEISRQVEHSSKIAATAVREASTANTMVNGLAGASQKIGEIVALINDIADQTNLLALNATIEAARAGEAGKGFAVVASEVKNLATQTSKATEDIRAQIAGVQSATQDAVRAIDSIGSTIGEINQIVTSIATAVEEQGSATKEIARNVEETAKGTREVSANITGVTQAASGTGKAAEQVLQVAGALNGQASDLRKYVVAFLAEVKAA